MKPKAAKRQTGAEREQAVAAKLGRVSGFYLLAFLYCLSPASCVTVVEESVAFSGGSPEVSIRGDTRSQDKIPDANADHYMQHKIRRS